MVNILTILNHNLIYLVLYRPKKKKKKTAQFHTVYESVLIFFFNSKFVQNILRVESES